MKNVAPFGYEDIVAIAGKYAANVPQDISVVGVCTDSRSLVPGNAFIALRGETHDGHAHIQSAIDKGASLVVADTGFAPNPSWNTPVVCVPNTLHCLGSFAWYHRRRFTLPVVAVAGATGKTSTKDLTAHVLSTTFHVLTTEANYNNQIGTPLTLLQLTSEHQAAVIEIGTNQPGEIELLSAMVQPTIGLITNIGKEHLEFLINLDGVEREETALFDYLRDHDGLALVNMDDERLAAYAGSFRKAITYAVDAPAEIRPSVSFDSSVRPTIHMVHGAFTFRAPMQSVGLASAYNAVCAVAVAWALQMHPADVQEGLTSYQPPAAHGYARMVVQHVKGATILNDSYNANPDSMLMALRTLQKFPAKKRIAVLGDMRELGAAAEEEHMRVLSEAESVADLVLFIGNEFRRAFERIDGNHVIAHETHRGLAEDLREHLEEGTAVLVKGSRGLQMERVIENLGF